MLCAKCHQKEATVHFKTVVGGTQDVVDLCKDCAPPMGLDLAKLDENQIEALSIDGKKCEFCGADAFSGAIRGSGMIYWCFDCGADLAMIFRDLLVAERPDLLQMGKDNSSFLAFCSDTDLQAWSAAAHERAVQTLKERRRKGGRGGGE